jgi:hypothetical protein
LNILLLAVVAAVDRLAQVIGAGLVQVVLVDLELQQDFLLQQALLLL